MRRWCTATALFLGFGLGGCLSSNPDWEDLPAESDSASGSSGGDGIDVTMLCDDVECGLGGTCVVDVAADTPAARCDCPAGAVDLEQRCVLETPKFSACGDPIRIGHPGTEELEGPHACPDGSRLAGMYATFDAWDRLTGFRMRCRGLRIAPEGRQVSWGETAVGGEEFGTKDVDYEQTLDCPSDQFVTSIRAYFGALTEDPADLRVMDRLELGCSTLTWNEDATFSTSEPTYVAQQLQGSSGLYEYSQVQETGSCSAPGLIESLTTSGGGHTDHFDITCACPGLGL